MQPSLRNEDAIFNTYIKSYNDNKDIFKHEYHFLSYRGGYSDVVLDNNILKLTSLDDIENTFNKTIEAFKYIKDFNFDYLIRVNISTYINLFILDEYIEELNKNLIYCNTVCTYYNSIKYKNEMFPRGDAYIIHKELFNKLLDFYYNFNINDYIDNGVDNTDDSMFGVVLSNYFNHKTHNYIQLLNYSFIPECIENLNSYNFKLSALTIFSRLKTVPPNEKCSGYSWEDNEYRKHDIIKFRMLNKYIFDIKNRKTRILFDNGTRNNFIISENGKLYSASFSTLFNILNKKNDN